MEVSTWLMLTAAALLAGMLNAVAGGGSFLTLPALIVAGLPPVAANATGTAALLPGYLSGAWTDRHKLRQGGARLPIRALVVLGTLGGAAGALLLLATSDQAFRGLIPWLLLFATLLFAFGPRLQAALQQAPRAGESGLGGRIGIFAVCGYGGYFNGGMGIVMLALFRLLGEEDLRAANALKNLLSAILTGIAVVIYTFGGIIYWPQLLPMAFAAFIGGWAGVALARRVPVAWLRYFVVAVGLLMTALFFWYG